MQARNKWGEKEKMEEIIRGKKDRKKTKVNSVREGPVCRKNSRLKI